MKEVIKFCAKAFFGGCLFALGTAVAASIFLVVLWLMPGELPFEKYILSQAMTPTPLPTSRPTPTGELPRISIWMTLSTEPGGERITHIPKGRLTELNVWAASNSNGSVPFRIWLIGPMGNDPWGPEFESSSDQGPISVGKFGSSMLPGAYHLEVRMGDVQVGRLNFEVTE